MLARLFFLLPLAALAHEVPVDATAQLWLRPQPDKLQLLLRVPLATLRDISFPERDGFLDIEKLDPLLPNAIKANLLDGFALYQRGQRLPAPRLLATQVSLPSDRSFATIDEALRHLNQPKPTHADRLLWNQVLLDLYAEVPLATQDALEVNTGFRRLATNVTTVVRYALPDGRIRAWQWTTDPGRLSLDPSWTQSAARFLALGIEHILSGLDHLLFVLCLVIPTRRWRDLVWIVTAFTAAHSLTLMLAALGYAPGALWFPPLIETLIAASILYMAIENCWRTAPTHRAALAFSFGLIHGCGFAFALHESLQFAGDHLLLSLVSFNLGVELGQLGVVLAAVPLLGWLFTKVDARAGVLVLSVLIGHTAWHWMLERGERLTQYSWSAATLLRLAAVALVVVVAVSVARRVRR